MATRRRRAALGAALSALWACGAISVDASAQALSNPNIKVAYTNGVAINFPQWIADKNGLFKRHGLNSTLVNIATSAADIVSGTIGGSVDVGCGAGSQAVLAAAENGAPIKAIWSQLQGVDYQFVINKKFADAKGIPAKGSPTEQIAKLKGSGIKVVFTSAASSNYTLFAAGVMLAGLQPGKDYSVSFAGSYSNIFAAYMSGQGDAFGATSPHIFRVKDDEVVRIEYSDAFPKQANYDFAYCFTRDEFAKSHPDTLVAFSKAMLQARDYIINQPEKARQDLAGFWNEVKITDPEVQNKATAQMQKLFRSSRTPALQRSAYQSTLETINLMRTKIENPPLAPISKTTYESVINNRFISEAIKALKMDLPTE